MASTTANMGLRIWDLLTDTFNHSDLVNNFDAIDSHDHTTGKGIPIPQGGLAPASVGTSQLIDSSVTTSKILDGAVTSGKLAAGSFDGSRLSDGSVTNAKLASPATSAYRSVYLATAAALGGSAYTKNAMAGSMQTIPINGGTTTSNAIPVLLPVVAADYTVPNLLTKFRIRAVASVNGTAPAVTFTIGLYPVSVSGATGTLSITLGTLVSSVDIVTPAINTPTTVTGTDFNLPSDGLYACGVTTSAGVATNSEVLLTAQVQVHNV